MQNFLSALQKEIALYAERYSENETIETIFFGGGTPSLLSPSTMENILSTLRKHFRIVPGAEVTVETNPGTVDAEKLRAYRSLGINRLSIGIQSFHDDELKFLSRIHTAEEAEACVRNAYRAGFENVSVDLIFSLPGQTLERWKENLARALILQPKHISAYSLIVEEHTPLYSMVKSGTVTPLDESGDAAMYEATIEMLESRSFHHYEISNYALSGFESRHNNNYWNHSNYLGFGPSAHSFWKNSFQDGRRWWNVRNVTQYNESLQNGAFPVAGDEQIQREHLLDETIFLSLRCGELNAAMIQQCYGVDFLSQNKMQLQQFADDHLISIEGSRIRLTQKGFLMCDSIAESLVSTSA
jgi:oxygen-independent coproporphyrinogen-3 oxidase